MQNISNTPSVTIDDLAVMVNKGFKEVAENLNEFKTEVRGEFKKVYKKFDDIDARFEKVDIKFKKIDDEFIKINNEFKKIYIELKEVKYLIKGQASDIEDHDQ